MVKINWSERAYNDLIQIYNYIYKDSKFFASKTVKEIIQSTNVLKIFPNIGRMVPEISNIQLRELIYKSYRIIYNIKSNKIFIRRIFHSARLLSKEDIIS